MATQNELFQVIRRQPGDQDWKTLARHLTADEAHTLIQTERLRGWQCAKVSEDSEMK